MTKKQRESLIKDDIPQTDGRTRTGAATTSDAQNGAENAVQIDASKSAAPENSSEKTMSKGEKVFNWTAYTGINYFLNLIISVGIADFFINLKGRKWLDSAISRTTQAIAKTTGSPAKKIFQNTKIGWESAILLAGGFTLLIPLKWMEDRKRPIVHWLNKKFGIEQKTADGKEKTPDEIYIEEEQPKQSWGNLIWRRMVGLVAVTSTGIALDHLARERNGKPLPPKTHDLGWTKVTYDSQPMGGKERVESVAFNWINKQVENLRGKKFANNGVVSRWTKLAILDSIFTVLTAVIMKVTNGAKKGKMPHEIDSSDDPLVIKSAPNTIITEDGKAKNSRIFAERVEKRAKELIEYKRNNGLGNQSSGSFVDSIQKNDGAALNIGV